MRIPLYVYTWIYVYTYIAHVDIEKATRAPAESRRAPYTARTHIYIYTYMRKGERRARDPGLRALFSSSRSWKEPLCLPLMPCGQNFPSSPFLSPLYLRSRSAFLPFRLPPLPLSHSFSACPSTHHARPASLSFRLLCTGSFTESDEEDLRCPFSNDLALLPVAGMVNPEFCPSVTQNSELKKRENRSRHVVYKISFLNSESRL